MPDARVDRVIARVVAEARQTFGPALVSIALYGSAVGEDYVPGESDLNFAIVLDQVRVEHLRGLHGVLPGWHRLGVATPLVVDRAFLDRARDVFPLELFEIQAQHRVLFGEQVFATLVLDGRNLRYEAEYEARSKLLRLRMLYAETGNRRREVETLVRESAKTFALVMKAVLRLRQQAAPVRYLEAVAAFEAATGTAFPTLRHALAVRLGRERWQAPPATLVERYLHEIERLVEIVDRAGVPEPAL